MVRRLLLLMPLVGCSPEQPEETNGCSSLADCTLGQVCDVELEECIDEPDDRFIGSFRCTVDDDFEGPAELVGNVGVDRWSLPMAFCSTRPDANLMLLSFVSVFSEDVLRVFLDLSELTDENAVIGPAILDVEDAKDYASIVNDGTALAYGYSKDGKVELSRAPAPGRELSGYLDMGMYDTKSRDEFFGVPCPRGLNDCGNITGEAGGARHCADLLNGLMCSRSCSTNGDCSRGSYVNDDDVRIDPVCLQGYCTKACLNHDDCEAPLRCTGEGDGAPTGCF
jgi:hypothetical protein